MAEVCVSWTQEDLGCPICLDVLENPVTIPCGHNFCMNCITCYWGLEDKSTAVIICPQCRQTFTPRPVLGRNTMLAEVVEKLKLEGLHSAPAAHCYAGPGDVECDICPGRKRKAVKSCLVCLASYCESHLKLHNKLDPEKKHKVVTATGKLQDMVCSQHYMLLDMFCQAHQECICVRCALDEHKAHKTVSVAAERNEKQKQLEEIQMNGQRRIWERENDLKMLKETIESLKHSAKISIQESERIFDEMILNIGTRCSVVVELIKVQEKAEVSRVEDLMEKVEQEIIQLKGRAAELQRLSQTEDHTQFLQRFQSVHSFTAIDNSAMATFHVETSFEQLKKSVFQLKECLDCELQHCGSKSGAVKEIPTPEPNTREDFLAYSRCFTLDPNTAQSQLHLFKGNREVTCADSICPYQDHPERFDYWQQVLCKEGVSERCYWEVEWSGGNPSGVSIGVSYKGVGRKGNDIQCWLGCNDQSWSMQCSSTEYCYKHSGYKTIISTEPGSSKIGVYVDHQAGVLSFYKVYRNTLTLLHKVHTKFTQPLYPGFWLNSGSKVKLCN